MSERPLVSVVMSVYNGEEYLGKALDSVLAQEGVEFEVVVVDDGSSDGSGDLLEERASSDPRLRVIRQPNGGLTRALIRGCKEARGDLIARQDADDVSLPGRLEKQARAMLADPSLAMVSCWARAVAPGGERLWVNRHDADPVEARRQLLLERRGPPGHGTVMFRKSIYEAVGGYRPQFWFAQDSDLWLRLAEVGGFLCLPEVLYENRIGDTNISTRWRRIQRRFGDFGHACRQCRLRGEPEERLLREAADLARKVAGAEVRSSGRRAAGSYMIGRWLLRERNPAALQYFERAVEREPWNLKARAGGLLARLLRGLRSGEVD